MGFTLSNIFFLALYLLVTLPLLPLRAEISDTASYTEKNVESGDEFPDQSENDEMTLTVHSPLLSSDCTHSKKDASLVSLLLIKNRLSFRYISIPPPVRLAAYV